MPEIIGRKQDMQELQRFGIKKTETFFYSP